MISPTRSLCGLPDDSDSRDRQMMFDDTSLEAETQRDVHRSFRAEPLGIPGVIITPDAAKARLALLPQA